MKTIAYNRVQKILYGSMKKDPFIIDVPAMNYLCFEGMGHPSEPDYQLSCETLYTLSYILKFDIARKQLDADYKVNPMEVSWLLDKSGNGIKFTWTMMIMQPDIITESHVHEAVRIAAEKGKAVASERVFFQNISFGRCVQCAHRGDYNLMNDTLAKMKAFAYENSLASDQYTHDIYLNDMRKTRVENYKTIMRIKTEPLL